MSQYDLIVTIINRGHADDTMAVAKKAGATGGTILNGRGTIKEDAAKFFGISLHAEKEMIFIVSKNETKAAIMQAIIQESSKSEESKCVVFSLPVDNALGFNALNNNNNNFELTK